MNPLISLVIPVYNVERYFPRCMESVLAQTYDNFEVILVDDGSTDSSGRMCDEYAARDARVGVIHKPNGGLSDARNTGVERARGELVAFVDSDDYVSEDYLELMWQLMETTGADISIVGLEPVYYDNSSTAVSRKPEECNPVIMARDEALEFMFYGTYFGVSACAKLYRRAMVVRHPFPVGVIYEDLFTTYKIFEDCEKVAFSAKPCYYYYQRQGSTVHPGKMEQRHWDALERAKSMVTYFEGKNADIALACRNRAVMLAMQYMNRLGDGSNESKAIFKKLAAEIKNIGGGQLFGNPKVSNKLKIKLLAVYMGYYPMRMLWRMIDLSHAQPTTGG